MTTYDTIIVGAGSAGCVLANRLSADPARKVLLLEAGRSAPLASDIPSDWPTMFNTSVDWSYYTEPQAGCRGRRIFWPRGKMIGGSGALNAMIYIRGLPSDYDGWAAMGCPGWGWHDVLPVFMASESQCRTLATSRVARGSDGLFPAYRRAGAACRPRTTNGLWIEGLQGGGGIKYATAISKGDPRQGKGATNFRLVSVGHHS